jgi:hypothetical protein
MAKNQWTKQKRAAQAERMRKQMTGTKWTPAQRRKFIATAKAKRAAREAGNAPMPAVAADAAAWTPAQRAAFAKAKRGHRSSAQAFAAVAAAAPGAPPRRYHTRGGPNGYQWTDEHRLNFAATLAAKRAAGVGKDGGPLKPSTQRKLIAAQRKEEAAARHMQKLFNGGTLPAVQHHNGGHQLELQNVITTEVKVGSEIAFSFGQVKVIVRAVA